jgi:hypothetical protein
MQIRPAARLAVLVVTLVAAASGAIAGPAHAAPARSTLAASTLAAEDLGYDYTYTTGMTWPQTQLQTPTSVMTEVGSNFGRYFPFSSDCLSLPPVGSVCTLYAIGGVFANPVQVVGRTSTSFTFKSLPGHFEGAGRFITFAFYKVGIDPFGDIRLRATASGPWTLNAYLTIQSGQAKAFWNQFAVNVGNAYR